MTSTSGNFQYIFWDNDGVLVDTETLYLQANREALQKIDITLCDHDFATISLTEGRSIFDLATELDKPDETIRALKTWRNQRYTELLEDREFTLAGVEDTLARLHGRVGMAIVTSSLKNHFDIIHRRTGFLKYIDFCLTREDYINSKPSPEPYQLALQRSGQATENVLVIEDSPRGLTAAKRANLTCWVIPGRHTTEQDFADADRILRNITELQDLI